MGRRMIHVTKVIKEIRIIKVFIIIILLMIVTNPLQVISAYGHYKTTLGFLSAFIHSQD
jgi:hypothetical protein